VLRFRGREIRVDDVAFVRDLIARRPAASRRALSIELCELWGWRQANGALRDAICRSLLLELHRAGHIALPEPAYRFRNAPARRTPEPVLVDTRAIDADLRALGSIELCPVRRTGEEKIVSGLIEHYHYLRYTQPVGEHLKYLITGRERPIGCFCWSSAPRHLAPRDAYIGWSAEARRAHIRFIAYQTRFLILPWVRVPHLASHLLEHRSV
jgi:hypothetical protein